MTSNTKFATVNDYLNHYIETYLRDDFPAELDTAKIFVSVGAQTQAWNQAAWVWHLAKEYVSSGGFLNVYTYRFEYIPLNEEQPTTYEITCDEYFGLTCNLPADVALDFISEAITKHLVRGLYDNDILVTSTNVDALGVIFGLQVDDLSQECIDDEIVLLQESEAKNA